MRHRQGFTLVELLVAMALTMFVMVILSEAFVTGLETFSGLKGIGDMTEKLRAATTVLRADLAADHHEGKRRPSDPDYYSNPPKCGFIRIYQGAAALPEGTDADGIQSFRSGAFPAANPIYGSHILHLSIKRRGSGREDFFTAPVPAGPPASPLLTASTTFFNQPADARAQDNANTYNSQWAEVAYVLVRTGSTSEVNVANSTLGTPLYALYRIQRVVVADNGTINFSATNNQRVPNNNPANINNANQTRYAQVSFRPVALTAGGSLQFNNPSDLTVPGNRAFQPATPGFTTANPASQGASLLMTNVISFHVRVLRSGTPLSPQQGGRLIDSDFGDVAFDSAGATTAGTINTSLGAMSTSFVSGIAVTLRVWDQKTQQTRQITVVQDM
ncbi:MAG TPA: prepilin-type N-terminal cleavage/methylation domain-containing protein [Gemmataceae bacterium]|nr:prepilin-type N-terminal cleavage/methylation domain-containing protein [Gemmataceae bacterium]